MKRLLLLWCLVPTLVCAQSLAEAETLYGDGDLAASLKMADTVLKRTTDARETGRLHVLRGLVLLAQGKKDKARTAFGQALQADASAQLDAERSPPAALALFAEARQAVPPGTVSISSTLSQATLRVDGADYGPLPLTTKLSIGRHTLEATGGDGRVVRSEVLVNSGQAQTVTLEAPRTLEPQAPVAQADAPPPLVPVEPSVSEPQRSATLIGAPATPAKMTWWGLIPIIAAAGGGWIVPPVFNSNPAIGIPLSLATIGALGLGVGLLVGSAVQADAQNGKPVQMVWWGLIPLGVGLVAAIIATSSASWLAGYSSTGAYVTVFSAATALVGLGIGSGMLIGHALGLPKSAPKVSFYALPEGGGLSVAGRF